MNFKLQFVVLIEKKDPFFYWMFFSLIGFLLDDLTKKFRQFEQKRAAE